MKAPVSRTLIQSSTPSLADFLNASSHWSLGHKDNPCQGLGVLRVTGYLIVELRSLQRLKHPHLVRPFVLLPAGNTDGVIRPDNPEPHSGVISLQLRHVCAPQVYSERQGLIRQQTSALYAGRLARGHLHPTLFRCVLHPGYRQQDGKRKSSRNHANYCDRYRKPALFRHTTPPVPALLQVGQMDGTSPDLPPQQHGQLLRHMASSRSGEM
jgi:hypothetical protein